MNRTVIRMSVVVLGLGLVACTTSDPLNTAGRRDGTRGNPPGTETSRAFDRTAGTNTSGAYPRQSDGTPANPPGTAVSRALGTTTR